MKGPTTYYYNPIQFPDEEKLCWIRVPGDIKTKCLKYSEDCRQIEIPLVETKKPVTQTPAMRSGPLIIAKSQRGTSLNTYYIENRMQKRSGDISIQIGNEMIKFTPIKGISGRFPEFYKHLSVATQKKNWSKIPNQNWFEILKTEIKKEIVEFVMKNLDTPSPERRFGPRKDNPSRHRLFH